MARLPLQKEYQLYKNTSSKLCRIIKIGSSSALDSSHLPIKLRLTWGHIENAGSDSPDGVGDSLGDGASEGPLLEGGDVVLGGATNGGKLAEAFGQTCQ